MTLARIGSAGPGTWLYDVVAGGGVGVPAARRGAAVLASDLIRRLAKKLAGHPGCEARPRDGQALDLADAGFDAAASITGVDLFPDGRRGRREPAGTVRRPGGRGGPFRVTAAALRRTFRDRAPPAPPDGFAAPADPERLAAAVRRAGFADIMAEERDTVWEGPAGAACPGAPRALHSGMGACATLGFGRAGTGGRRHPDAGDGSRGGQRPGAAAFPRPSRGRHAGLRA